MGCDLNLLSRYLDRELTLPERRRLEKHLRSCKACQGELVELRRLNDLMSAWGHRNRSVPARVDARVAASIETRRPPAPLRALNRMTPAAFGTAVAALLVVLSANFGWLYVNRPVSGGYLSSPTVKQSMAKRSAPLLAARRTSAILGGEVPLGGKTTRPHVPLAVE